MRKVLKVIAKAVAFILLCFLIVIVGFLNTFNVAVYAATSDESVPEIYENTNVLNNLKGATIGGKEFDLADYPHNANGNPQIISFVEFCYSYYAEKQADYGLYVYVYNPQDVAFDMTTERNKIQFTYGGTAGYSKYTLEFINYSTEAGYEGRFWKFKVRLTDEQRAAILKGVDESNRIYKISGIELSYKGKVTEYACGQTYTYKGYALGYGSELADSDTLSCKVDGFDKYLTLDVRSTYYRPKGTNGEAYARDTLHSVYFSVPNAIIDEYGEMTAVHATWLNAFTNPIFVTGNETVYDNILPYVGKDVDGGNFSYAKDDDSPVKYSLIAGAYNESASWNNASYGSAFISYNDNAHYTNSKKRITNLQYCFLADNGDADNYTLPAETLVGNKADGTKGYFETFTDTYDGNSSVGSAGSGHGGGGFRPRSYEGQELVNGKYDKKLFESVADSFTDITIAADDKFTLTDEVISQSLWQKFVGGGYVVTNTNTYTVSAIKKVGKDDFKSTAAATCKELYIDESDYKEFKSYYDAATGKKETVYLFRYYQSDYTCYEAIEYGRGSGDWTLLGTQFGYDYVDTNAYLMQMWVQLDFDIIDLTFTKNNVDTVIPVIMSPMDITADGAPPVITTKNNLKWWQILLGVIAVLIIVILLLKFAPGVVTIIGKILIFPFKCIVALFKAISNAIKKRRQKRKEKKENSNSENDRELIDKLSISVYQELRKRGYLDSDSFIFSDEIAAHEVNRQKQEKSKRSKNDRRKKRKKSTPPKPPDLNGNVTPEEVESYLDSIDWDSIDWTKFDGKGG